jgi:hypothetical protein
MAYGKNKGRFREIRVGRFVPNMGALAPGVKSTNVEGPPNGRYPKAGPKPFRVHKVVKYSL